jgi:hypothetical protein
MDSARRTSMRRASSFLLRAQWSRSSKDRSLLTPPISERKRESSGERSLIAARGAGRYHRRNTGGGRRKMLMVICDDRYPALSKLVALLHRELGFAVLRQNHYVIPADCAPSLARMETAAASLSTSHPAPEDEYAAEYLRRGEDPRYLDSEATSFVVDEDLADRILPRVPHGAALRQGLDRIRTSMEKIDDQVSAGRTGAEAALRLRFSDYAPGIVHHLDHQQLSGGAAT